MRRGWCVKGGSSGSGQLTKSRNAKVQLALPVPSTGAQRGSGLFFGGSINFHAGPFQLLGNAPRQDPVRTWPPTKARNCRGTCSAPHGRTTACSDGDIKEPGLNGCVRDGSFSTTAKPFQGRTLMTTWMSSDKLEPLLFAKEPCDFPFPLLSHTPINSFSPLSFDSSRSISSSAFRGGHECIAWPP